MDQYDLFLFDLDGTLINTELLHYTAYENMFKHYKLPINLTFTEYCKYAHLDDKEMEKYVTKYTNIPYTQLYATKKQFLLDSLNNDLKFIDGAEQILVELIKNNKTTCIVTHSDRETLDTILCHLPLLNKVTKIITRTEYINRKPHPECYLRAINMFESKNPIGFEDSYKGYQALSKINITNVFIGDTNYYYYNKINPMNTFKDFAHINWSEIQKTITNYTNYTDITIERYIGSLKTCNNNFTKIISQVLPLINNCTQNIYLTGIGKCGHIAKKSVSTWQSVGISCHYVNIPDLFHGDFGILKDGDIIIYISNSGNTDDLIKCSEYIKNNFRVLQIALTIKETILMAKHIDFHFTITDHTVTEIDTINMAPTVSSVLFMCILDMIGIKLAEERGLTIEKFKLSHPGGDLGKVTNNKIDYIVIVASGHATRLFPITKYIPKILINYNNKPFIEHLIEYWQNYCKKIIIIVNSKYCALTNFYANKYFGITVLPYDIAVGTADTINNTITKEYYSKNILFTWCDILPTTKLDIQKLTDTCVFTSGNECRYGVCDNRVQKMSNGNIIGIYYIKNYTGLHKYNTNDDICDIFNDHYSKFITHDIFIQDVGDMPKYKKLQNALTNTYQTRFFNKIVPSTNGTIVKTSINTQGDSIIANEIMWYKNINIDNIPKILNYTEKSYEMELLDAHPLYTHFNTLHDDKDKLNIIDDLIIILDNLHSQTIQNNEIMDQKIDVQSDIKIECLDKVINRISKIKPVLDYFNNIDGKIEYVNGIKILNYDTVLDKCYQIVKESQSINSYTIIHGDCQFSNILYGKNKLFLIDPRGYFGKTRLMGIPEYDYAKILYALSGYDEFNSDPYFSIDNIQNNNITFKIKNHFDLFAKLPEKILNKTTLALVTIIWLSLAQYNINNVLKCIASYYYGLYFYSKFLEHSMQ